MPHASNPPVPGTRAHLEALGFEGFLAAGQLHDERCERVPDERGVYALLRESPEPPKFMPRGTAPVWRGRDPNVPVEELAARWVPGAQVVYVGRARGPGVRSLLKQRVKRMLRFGHGRVVGHWGGRFVWQLTDHSRVRIAWLCTPDRDPAEVEAALLAEFVRHWGTLPFANLREEHAGEDE